MEAFSIWRVLRKADVGAQAATGDSMHRLLIQCCGVGLQLVVRPRGLRDVLGVDLERGVEATPYSVYWWEERGAS